MLVMVVTRRPRLQERLVNPHFLATLRRLAVAEVQEEPERQPQPCQQVQEAQVEASQLVSLAVPDSAFPRIAMLGF